MVKKFSTFGDLLEGVTTDSSIDYTIPENVPANLTKMIIEATHQSSYTDTVTLKDAFEAVDQSEFQVRNLRDAKTGMKINAPERREASRRMTSMPRSIPAKEKRR